MTQQISRATRLLEIERLLRRRPQGYSAVELARELGYSSRTIQRDILALQSDLNLPLIDMPGRRYAIMPGSSQLVPVRLTLQEARAILLATRLFLRYADERDRDGISALEKIAEALPEPVGARIRATADQIKARPVNKRQEEVMRRLTEAWATSHTVTMTYRSQNSRREKTTDLDPYLFEPSASGSATYVIGYSHAHGAIRTFKADRITRVEVTTQTFVPKDIDAISRQIAESWGVVFGDDHYDITIEFSKNVAARIAETAWHPSQRLTQLPGGGVRLELTLPSLLEFVPWVLGWGPEAVVISPPELRDQVSHALREAAARYGE
jgi:predicted DNA-binding transcriptional regulator YafY